MTMQTLQLHYSPGSVRPDRSFRLDADGEVRHDCAVLHVRRTHVGLESGLRAVDKVVELRGGWPKELASLMARTELEVPPPLLGARTVSLSFDGRKLPLPQSVPHMPTNKDEWLELTEALGAAVDDKPIDLSFVRIDGASRTDLVVTQNTATREVALRLWRNGLPSGPPVALTLDVYKQMHALMRRLSLVGRPERGIAAAPTGGQPKAPVPAGLYVQRGDGLVSNWDLNVGHDAFYTEPPKLIDLGKQLQAKLGQLPAQWFVFPLAGTQAP